MEETLMPKEKSCVQLIDQFEKDLLSFDRVALNKRMAQSERQWGPIQFVEKIMVPVLERIGTGWEQGKLALSQVYMSGCICEELVDTILPPDASDRTDQSNIAICVLEDHHFLGKRIVYAMLRASGFELKDYGRVTVDELVSRVQDDHTRIILISVLMLPSALLVKQVKEKLDALDLDIKLIVGGAPFSFDSNLWKEVGADGVGAKASDAADIINKIIGRIS